MRIRMKTAAAGPTFRAVIGEILLVGHDVTPSQADALVGGGFAEEIPDEVQPAPEGKPVEPVEEALAPPAPEVAVAPEGRPRGRTPKETPRTGRKVKGPGRK